MSKFTILKNKNLQAREKAIFKIFSVTTFFTHKLKYNDFKHVHVIFNLPADPEIRHDIQKAVEKILVRKKKKPSWEELLLAHLHGSLSMITS